jgi:hypothetical protein
MTVTRENTWSVNDALFWDIRLRRWSIGYRRIKATQCPCLQLSNVTADVTDLQRTAGVWLLLTQRVAPDERTLRLHRCENLKTAHSKMYCKSLHVYLKFRTVVCCFKIQFINMLSQVTLYTIFLKWIPVSVLISKIPQELHVVLRCFGLSK